MWWLSQTSGTHIWESLWFESMYTLQGKIQPTHHTLFTLSPHMVIDHTYLTRSTCSNLSRSCQQSWTDSLLLRKRKFWLLPEHAGWPICGSPSSFSPLHNHRSNGESHTNVNNRLLGPYTSMRSVCSILARGANPSVLNRHRRGLQPWRYRLSTYHSPTFSTDGLPFPPKGPAQS
jgi:hypothetical protein